jgi:hypothetical protein
VLRRSIAEQRPPVFWTRTINFLARIINRAFPTRPISASMRLETAKRDWVADWNKWSRAERVLALLVIFVLLALPLSLFFTGKPAV